MLQHALILEQNDAKTVTSRLAERTLEPPAAGRVQVAVSHSGINYKDALAVTGRGRIVRQYPRIPGIDLAGEVVASADPRFAPGDPVLATGWGMGEGHDGGFTSIAEVESDWLLPLPEGLDAAQAMLLGTAGLTAMLCIMALERHGLRHDGGEILISGASGGVGSIALRLLSLAGYECVALSGRAESQADYLTTLGASRVLPRSELLASSRPLDSAHYQAAIDVAGGQTLHAILKSLAYRGAVAACGLADSAELPTSVFPFILRGVSLLGIDSVYCPNELRNEAWQRLAAEFPPAHFLTLENALIGLEQVAEYSTRLLDGELHGRVLVQPGD